MDHIFGGMENLRFWARNGVSSCQELPGFGCFCMRVSLYTGKVKKSLFLIP